MTAPDPQAIIADLMGEHRGQFDVLTYSYRCDCGEKWPALPSDHHWEVELHEGHVAAVLAADPRVAIVTGDGVHAIAAERTRQKEIEVYTPEHDAEHGVESLCQAADAYLHDAESWPWSPDSFKRTTPERDLAKAGALIAAALDVFAAARAAGGES